MATPDVCSMMRDAATPTAEAPDLGGSWVVPRTSAMGPKDAALSRRPVRIV